MALPSLDEVLKKNKISSLPSIDEVLGKQNNKLPSIDEVLGRKSTPMASIEPEKLSKWDTFKSIPGKIDDNIDAFVDAGANKLTFGLHNKLMRGLGKEEELQNQDKIAGKIGGFTGDAIGIGKGYSLASKGLKKIAPKLEGIKKIGAIGTATGIGYQGLKETTDTLFDTREDGSQTLGKRAANIGIEGALFGGIDVAARGAGKGIKWASDKTGTTDKLKSLISNVGKKETASSLAPKLSKGSAPEKLSDAVELGKRIKDTQMSVKATERKIANLNKNMQSKGITPRMQERMGVLSKELAANKKILDNRKNKFGRTKVDELNIDPIDYTPDNVKALVKTATENIDFSKLKDFSGFKYNSTDIYRNMRDVFKDSYPQVKKLVMEPFDNAKKEFAGMQKNLTKALKENVVDRLGITKGSKLSKAVQDFGEKKLTLEQLQLQYPKEWGRVVEADRFFRSTYDGILDTINATRAKIYPNNPEKLIPKRSDYYRHFREMNDLVGLKNIFDSPSAIDPGLVGISEFTRPNSKFQGFMQKRGLGKYKSDAVGGFLEYIPGASYATHIDPHINVFKRLADEIRVRTEETKNMNSLIGYLDKYSQDLAGKTNQADRWIQDNVPGGRKTMGVVRWINNRVKSNTILGNAASALAQTANIPNGIAATKQHSVKGAGRTLKSIINREDALVNQSPFLNERFVDRNYRQFDTRWFEQPRRAAEWMIETADRLGTEFIWNSGYEQAIAKKIPNPIDYADDLARRMVAGRGVGEVPLLQKSNVFQIIAPFQLEVANAWRVMGDFVKAKDATALITLFLGSYMFNKAMEEVRGSGVVFDPVQSIVDASREGLSPIERAGRLGGEVLSNVPLGQSAAVLYPEYGGNVLGQELPSREKLFGDKDPTRFGTGLVAGKIFTDPLRYGLLPFGGNQLNKTTKGVQSLLKGGFEKDGKLRFPVERTPNNLTKGLLFGPSATTEGKNYYNKDRRPLSENQTLDVKGSNDPNAAYEDIQTRRSIDTVRRKMKDIENDEKLSNEEKEKQLDRLYKQWQELRGW
jgi:hypothetical protein